MKKLFTLVLIITAFSAKADYWTQKAMFPGIARQSPFSFSINNKGYVGCGKDTFLTFFTDFWEYDQQANSWTQKANFPGGGRIYSVGFSIGNKGYAGTGNAIGTVANDFWEYNPLSNVWLQKANYIGGRIGAASFSYGNKGYISCGWDGVALFHRDLWEYNPALDSWTQKANLPGFSRYYCIGFSIGSKGYVGLGADSTGLNQLSDFWEYDIILNVWTQITDFPPVNGRIDVAAFSICDKAFLGTGEDQYHILYNDFWQYNPALNQWVQKTNFPYLIRDETAFFSIGNKGYIGIGGQFDWFGGPSYCFNDFWEYTPDSINCTTGIEEIANDNLEFTISPNPAHQYADISWSSAENKNAEIIITTLEGKKVFSKQLENKTLNFKLQTLNFPKGIYLVQIISNKKVLATQKLVVE